MHASPALTDSRCDQYDQLFEHFAVLGRVERARFGEERTRRLCLEAFDRLEKEGRCNR